VPDPRWSVLLPTHDAPATLRASVDSVLAQSDGDLELLLVADGVTAATRRVIEGIVDDRVRIIDLPKGDGLGYAHRRRALATARGRYIAFASDDDLWAPHHLATLGPSLDAGAALAHSISTWVLPDGRVVPVPFALDDPGLREAFRRSNYLPSTCVAITAHALDEAGGWPIDVPNAADWTLWRTILDSGSRASAVPHATTLHFRSPRRSMDHPTVKLVAAMSAREGWPGAQIEPHLGEALQATVAVASAEPGWWDSLDAGVGRVIGRAAFVGIHASAELGKTQAELRKTQAELAAVRSALVEQERAFRSSGSWRLTAPVRAAASAARRLRRR